MAMCRLALGLLLMPLLATAQPPDRRADPPDAAQFREIAEAQVANPGADPLDSYLYQAFSAPLHAQREALYHLGAQGRLQSGGYQLSAVLEGYPAHTAGLRRGDVIVSSNGNDFHPVVSFTSPASVRLTVNRNGEELELSLSPVRENLFDSYRQAVLHSVQQFSVGNKVIGYIRLWGLSRTSSDIITLRRLLGELQLTDGLILDLRDGFGFTGPEHLAMFRGNLGDDFYARPMALLINDRTRGGLQSLAQQLVDLERVISIGAATAGETALVPEVFVDHPIDQSIRSDPVYQAAVDVLLGVI